MTDTVRPLRVRFAPSPTGYLHVGGARTALYNWCLARRLGGTFILRIEDTDRERSSEEMVQGILDGMRWLGLDWDEGPFFQGERTALHIKLAQDLRAAGAAYPCFCSAATLDADRRSAEAAAASAPAATGSGASGAASAAYRYPGTCRSLEPDAAAARAAKGDPHCLRFRVPDSGSIAWDDVVHGRCEFKCSEIEDFVLLRSDGSPTYNLAVVADDVDMRVSHVLRGDDHISNTPKQSLMYRALGLEPPTFGHLPLILGPDKKKLSKRTGTTSVTAYREQGYLPEVMFNFLALLGWAPGDGREVMMRAEIVHAFALEGLNNSPAVFDLAKLDWLNGQHLQRLDPAELVRGLEPLLAARGLWSERLNGEDRAWLVAVVELLRPRARKLADLAVALTPFLSANFDYEPEAAAKHLKGDGLAPQMRELLSALAGLESFDVAATEAALRATAERLGIKAGALIHATRVGVTGQGVSPGIFEVLALMGKERTLSRLDRLAAHLEARPA